MNQHLYMYVISWGLEIVRIERALLTIFKSSYRLCAKRPSKGDSKVVLISLYFLYRMDVRAIYLNNSQTERVGCLNR